MTPWRILGSSVAGFVHVEKGRGCDDAHGWATADEVAVAVVADGAGSRPGTSAIGAHVAVAAVIERSSGPSFAAEYASNPGATTSALVAAAVSALAAEAETLGIELRLLATTICVAVLDGPCVTVAQVGDGVAVIERASGAIEAVAVADQFEYVNETVFLTAPDVFEHLKIFATTDDPVRSVALTTDGLRYKVLDDLIETRPFEQFFRDSWDYARSEQASSEAVEKFLQEVDDQTGDDKTLLLGVTGFAGPIGEFRHLTDRPPPPPPPEVDAVDEVVGGAEDALT